MIVIPWAWRATTFCTAQSRDTGAELPTSSLLLKNGKLSKVGRKRENHFSFLVGTRKISTK